MRRSEKTEVEARKVAYEVWEGRGGGEGSFGLEDRADEVIVLADGARWIWNLVDDLSPHAIQILDFSYAKHYLWEAGNLIYGEGSAFVAPWVKEQETLLLENKGAQVMARLPHFLDLRPALASILHYFQQNAARMRYGTYR